MDGARRFSTRRPSSTTPVLAPAFIPPYAVSDSIINVWLGSGERLAREQDKADVLGGVLLSV